MENKYDLVRWQRPSHYGGFNPEGDFFVFARTRDSNIIDRCNWLVMLEVFERLNTEHAPKWFENPDLGSGNERFAYTFVASHWGVGWVEYLLLRQDAPEEFQQVASDFLATLEFYPVLDDERLFMMEHEEAQQCWDHSGYRERMRIYREVRPHDSFFSVRRAEVPDWAMDYYRERL
jgi:hypothetical protein